MPPKNDIFETLELKWGICKPYDDFIAKVDYIEQTDAGIKVHCHKVEKENKKMKMDNFIKDIEKIVITKDGDNSVLCRGYGKNNLVVTSRSFCSPDDIFDFNIGAKLAMDRMYEGYDMTPKPKRKPYNGLIYIDKYPGSALKDKSIYRVKDGVIQRCVFGARPFIYTGMSDEELSKEIDNVVYGRNDFGFYLIPGEENNPPLTVAYFVDNDKT